jgi:hypothetical protein
MIANMAKLRREGAAWFVGFVNPVCNRSTIKDAPWL